MKKIPILLVFLMVAFTSTGQQVQNPFLQEGIEKYSKAEYYPAIELFLRAVSDAKRTNDSTTLQSAYTNLGNTYSITGKIEKALEYYQEATDIASGTKDTVRLAKITANIGALYSDQKDFDKALSYFDQAEKLAVAIALEDVLADCATNKGIIYEQLGNYDLALELHKQALHSYEKIGSQDRIALAYNNLGIVYKFLNRLEESLRCYEKTLSIATQLEDRYIMAATYANLANLHLLLNQKDKAIEMNNRAIKVAIEIDAPAIIAEVYGNLSDVYESQGDYKKALSYAQRYKKATDSLVNSERSAQLAEMREKYETERKESENKELKQQAEIKSRDMQEQALILQKRNILLAASIGFILLSGIAVYLYFEWQKGKNKQARDEAIRNTEEQERMRIARDLHDDLGAGLTKIKWLTAMASDKTQFSEVQDAIQSLSETASELVVNMRDMVWALNPENTTLDYLIARIREYSHEYLENHPIDLKINTPNHIPESKITSLANRNILLIVKECLQNVVKHSEASFIELTLEINQKQIKLSIRDNGKGMDQNIKGGNGLNNIKKRTDQIAGELIIETAVNKGTAFTLNLNLDEITA